jgi:pimeloyl-ACP methyl ester carboxylesterase
VRGDLRALLSGWYRPPLFESHQHHGLVEEMVERRSTNDPNELARALGGLGPGHQPSLWARLGEIEVPTLVMTGVHDDKYEDITKRSARLIGTADRVLVPEAGHNVHAERPQAFLAHLSHFLARS